MHTYKRYPPNVAGLDSRPIRVFRVGVLEGAEYEAASEMIGKISTLKSFLGALQHCIERVVRHRLSLSRSHEIPTHSCWWWVAPPGNSCRVHAIYEDQIQSEPFDPSTGDASPMAMEPTECQSKRGVAFDFKDANDLDTLAPGLSWW